MQRKPVGKQVFRLKPKTFATLRFINAKRFPGIYVELGQLGRGQEFANRNNQPYSPNTRIIHLTAILV